MSHSQLRQSLDQFQLLVKSRASKTDPNTVSMIKDLKLAVVSLPSLDSSQKHRDPEELLAARRFEELLVFYSLESRDIVEFESALKRLKVLYEDYKHILKKSENQNEIVAINLLYLLSYNKISDFHTDLQLVPYEDYSNPHIDFVLSMERSLMEGNYKHVVQLKSRATLEHFQVFLDRILETIRFEVARSSEKAYKKLSIADAMKLFQLNSQDDLLKYIKSQEGPAREEGIQWRIDGGFLLFELIDEGKKKINADQIIQTMIHYTNELERIV